jgi:parvulin-like peptidyl-prolyl isomerase
MDESCHSPSVRIHRGLFALALAASLASGCEQLGLGKSKTNPVVPAPPERTAPVDSPQKTSQVGSSPAAKLDGSAAGSESAVAVNAPGIAGSQTLAAAMAQGNPAAVSSLPPVTDPALAGDLPKEATDGDDTSEEAMEIDPPATRRDSARPGKVVQVADRTEPDSRRSETVAETGNDVIRPIETEGAGTKLPNGEVAVLVNGVPLFTEDVLRGLPPEFAPQLARAEKDLADGTLPPGAIDEVRKAQKMVKTLMKQHIDQELLLQALKAKLKDEQLTGITKQLDGIFNNEYLPGVMKQNGVTTQGELELILQKSGSSVESVRTVFRNRELARQFLQTKQVVHDGFDRPDILKYYREHLEDYAVTGKAKWEHIQIKFDPKKGGKPGAQERLNAVLSRLEAKEVFAVVAKELSEGPTASKGGLWGWTTQGSYKAPEIDKAVFEQPEGEIGPPIETKTSFDIVRVIERIPAHYKSFDEVYDEIKNHLKTTASDRRSKELLKELNENATIERFIGVP